MQCPKCGFVQPDAEECTRCGVVVRRVHAAAHPPLPPSAGATAARGRGVAGLVPIAGFFAATAALLVFFHPQRSAPRTPGRAQAAPQAPGSRAGRDGGWYEGASGYRAAEEMLRRDGRPMALYFHTSWCGWCRKMDDEILSSPETAAWLASVSAVRIDPESGPEEGEIARSYGVRGYPTFLVVPARGGAPRRVHPFLSSGTMSPAAFVAACREAE